MPEGDRYRDRRDAGLCVACGQGQPEKGRAKCASCLLDGRERSAKRRADAASKGLCEACMRRKRAPGRGNRCDECADKYLERQLDREREARSAKRA